MAPREDVPDLDDEFGDDTDDGHLAGAGSLLSIKIRGKRHVPDVRPRTLSERLVDHWTAVMGEKGRFEASDFSNPAMTEIWSHCFEFELDAQGKYVRVKRIGRIVDGFAGITESGFEVGRRDLMRRSPELAAMLIAWLESLAQNSYRSRKPLTESESFPIRAGNVAYTCTVVPLINQQSVPVSVAGLIESVERNSNENGLN